MPNGFAAASCAASLRLPRYNLSQILVMPMIIASWRGKIAMSPSYPIEK